MNEEKYACRVVGTDILPFEIIRKISDKTIEIRQMDAGLDPNWRPKWVNTGNFIGAECVNNFEQKWIFKSNTDYTVFRIRKHKSGFWRDANGNRYKLSDIPIKFYNYNF